jgi:hypothetical protein
VASVICRALSCVREPRLLSSFMLSLSAFLMSSLDGVAIFSRSAAASTRKLPLPLKTLMPSCSDRLRERHNLRTDPACNLQCATEEGVRVDLGDIAHLSLASDARRRRPARGTWAANRGRNISMVLRVEPCRLDCVREPRHRRGGAGDPRRHAGRDFQPDVALGQHLRSSWDALPVPNNRPPDASFRGEHLQSSASRRNAAAHLSAPCSKRSRSLSKMLPRDGALNLLREGG